MTYAESAGGFVFAVAFAALFAAFAAAAALVATVAAAAALVFAVFVVTVLAASAAVSAAFVALGAAFAAFLAEIVGFFGGRTFVAAGIFKIPAADRRGDLFINQSAQISGVFDDGRFRTNFFRFVEDGDAVRAAQWVERGVGLNEHWGPVVASLDLQVQEWNAFVNLKKIGIKSNSNWYFRDLESNEV